VTLAAGTRLGSYEILGPLGAGGMGEVYRARDSNLSREVAIKVLPSDLASDAGRLSRFEKEARTASALNHPNIVTIYEVGRVEGVSFIAMELVAGKTLRETLAVGAIPLKRLLPIAAQAADGLAKAHAAGIVHRDLKPENLMITKDGFVKILDFGLAKLVPGGFHDSGGTNLPTLTRGTEQGTVLGTVGYMSPEQAGGEAVDFRSDQFAFGAILYEMASGRKAFDRKTPVQTLSAVIEDEPEPLGRLAPKTPTPLIWIVERCLAKDPEERYGSTRDLARDLATLRDHGSDAGSSTSAQPIARPFRPSRRLLLGLAAGAILGSAVTFWLGQIRSRREQETPGVPPRQLTFRRGYLTGARFTPDGKTIVYSAAWDGKPSEIFTMRVDRNESLSLEIFPAGILAVSSAGELAVSLGCSDRWEPCFGTLARVPPGGGAPREVLENVGSADWSPDGKELAAVHSVDGGDRIEYPIGTVLYKTEGYLTDVRVSPKGDRVAFLEHLHPDSQDGLVCVVDRAGHKKNLTGQYLTVNGTLWSPSGEEIFFGANVTGRGGQSWGVDLNGRIRAAGIPSVSDVSRDGLFLDYGSAKRADIFALVPGMSKERNLSWLGASIAADLSMDGRKLLFFELGKAVSKNFVTFLRKTDGSDPAMLGEGKALALSPDDKWALVARPNPKPHLVLLPTGVGAERSLPGGDVVQYDFASFFPDSRRILFAAEGNGHVVRSYIQEIAGGPPRVFGQEGESAVLVSPDGTQIAGTTGEGLPLLFPVEGEGRARAIGGAVPGDAFVQWSGDGKFLYLRGAEEQPLVIYRVELATGKRERWKELAPADPTGFVEFGPGPKGVRVTPDGKSYAYTFWSGSGSLVVMEGNGAWWK